MLNKIATTRFGERYMGTKGVTIGFSAASYWGADDYFIDNKHADQIVKVLNIINKSSKVNITKNDVIYTTKSSEIPRFKLKEFIKETGVKKTTRHAYANTFIINRGTFNDLIKKLKQGKHLFINSNLITDKNIKEWFQSDYNKEYALSVAKTATNKNQAFYVMVDNHNQKQLDSIFKKNPAAKINFEDSTHIEEGIIFQTYRENKLVEFFNLIITNLKRIIDGEVKFIWDEELFVDLNKEGIELDDDYLQTLRDMLFSKDDSNVKLGFEMMSNLVLDQPTLLTISFLLNEMFHTTRFRPSYYSNTNTNLKALLKLLRTKGISWDRDWKTFGTGLRTNFKEGKEGEIVKKFLLDNINREFKLKNSAAESLVDIVFSTEAQ